MGCRGWKRVVALLRSPFSVSHGIVQQPNLGKSLYDVLLDANNRKRQMGDDYVSVEHLFLAVCKDTRFGTKLLREFGLTEKEVEDAVKKIRGSSKVD